MKAMKNSILTIIALATAMAWTGCVKDVDAPEEISWTLTVRAEKADDPDTRGLSIGDGKDEASTTRLQSIWKDGEKVFVFQNGTVIGTLNATPDAANAHLATLTGTINSSSLSGLTMLTPRATMGYTGQNGTLLIADENGSQNSIERLYQYTLAQNVSVTSIQGNNITIGHVIFKNQQSIYRINFRFQKDGAGDKLPITTRQAWFSAADARLVQSCAVDGNTSTGSIDVKPGSPTADPFFAALRFANTSKAEALNFKVLGNDGVTYYGSKTIPADYKPHGSFVSIKNAVLTERLEFDQSATKVDTAL